MRARQIFYYGLDPRTPESLSFIVDTDSIQVAAISPQSQAIFAGAGGLTNNIYELQGLVGYAIQQGCVAGTQLFSHSYVQYPNTDPGNPVSTESIELLNTFAATNGDTQAGPLGRFIAARARLSTVQSYSWLRLFNLRWSLADLPARSQFQTMTVDQQGSLQAFDRLRRSINAMGGWSVTTLAGPGRQFVNHGDYGGRLYHSVKNG